LLDTVLARHPFFSQLGKQLIEIVPAMRMTLLDYGQYLTRKGQPSEEMVCVVTGACFEIERLFPVQWFCFTFVFYHAPHVAGSSVILDESSKSFHAGGGEPVLPLLNVHPGALFGERCLLGVDSKYYVTVRSKGRDSKKKERWASLLLTVSSFKTPYNAILVLPPPR